MLFYVNFCSFFSSKIDKMLMMSFGWDESAILLGCEIFLRNKIEKGPREE